MRMNQSQIGQLQAFLSQVQYENDLDCAVRKVRKLLKAVGCKVEKDGAYVRLVSPRTGCHSLNMSLGVRPVSDLLIHAQGFAEQQTHTSAVRFSDGSTHTW